MEARRLSKIISLLTVFVLLLSAFTFTIAEEKAPEKPVIGISWARDDQAGEYSYYKAIIEEAGGVAVELPKITCSAVEYGEDGKVKADFLEESGMLKQEYADAVKSRNFALTNAASALDGIDGVFFTGGEDVSPTLFAVPQKEANEGEEINATRDISDYVLMVLLTITSCLAVPREVMGIVAGSDTIRMSQPAPPGALPRRYAPHAARRPEPRPRAPRCGRHAESHLYKMVGGTSFRILRNQRWAAWRADLLTATSPMTVESSSIG